jgi:hypothetical protein
MSSWIIVARVVLFLISLKTTEQLLMHIFLLGAERIRKYRLVENVGSWVKVPDNPGKIFLFFNLLL